MKYSKEVHDAMYDYYEEDLNDKTDRQELISTVDSLDKYELFQRLCNWNGIAPSKVEYLYELFFGKGENKDEIGFFKNVLK